MKYRVRGGKLVVKARSSIHDTVTTWDQIAGEVEADPETLTTAGATATFTVAMTAFDAGDWLKNRKLRKDFELEAHPTATFQLRNVSEVVRDGAKFTAKAEGLLTWRSREVTLELTGEGTLGDTLSASASFELDIKRLGLSAPKFLMFKMSDEVAVSVTIDGVKV
jgi:polyisoprenoid-binding protein YceI